MDFYRIVQNTMKNGNIEIYPDFIISNRYKDLMIKGRAFYAIWDEQNNVWSTNECRVAEIIDADLDKEAERLSKIFDGKIIIRKMQSYHSTVWKTWKTYISSLPDNFHQLDMNILFANHELKRNDYASKKLSYPLVKGKCDNYKELIATLYDIEERRKIEWAIGAIVAGDAKNIQKFMVLYGDAGAGKSTVLNIIEMLFDGYCSTFDAKALTTNNNSFATEVFRNNPLIAIQHDGDLSRIEDNTKLNSIVSHENIMINEKYKSGYPMKMSCFLFLASNNPVKITNGKSGLIRRLIDVHPSGNKVTEKRYYEIMDRIPFELGAIASHCLDVYTKYGKNYYATYKPVEMMYKTDPFFNFVEDNYTIFSYDNEISYKAAYKMYLDYCDETKIRYVLSGTEFREEMKNYFKEFHNRYKLNEQVINGYYIGFLKDKFNVSMEENVEEEKPCNLVLDSTESILDKEFAEYPAQYTKEDGTPKNKWVNVKTKLCDLDTTKLHYVNVDDLQHIFIDFDLKDENGNKSYLRNLEAASKWPATYAELSKSGCGIHLHYIYDGDTSKLSHYYDENIEIKTFNGNTALRRQLTKCNNLPIAHLNSGLPLKGDTKMVNYEGLKNEKAIRTMILRNMNKEYHDATKPSIDYIYKILDDAYKSGMPYDVSDMKSAVFAFATCSTNQSDYCTKLVTKMKWKSEIASEDIEMKNPVSDLLAFYDVEVFPNVLIICWKLQGKSSVIRMINPTPSEVEQLLRYKLTGFNCRKYDNHILHARIVGYSNEEIFQLSQDIIERKKGFFREAYNYSYTDVYDYASAGNKKSLKKWQIELGLSHVENEYPWDKPLPEDKWQEVADYCANDVISTEAVHEHLVGDWTARKILAKWTGMTCNDTTNNLSARIIFGKNKNPQQEFNYRDLSKPVRPEDIDFSRYRKDKVWRIFDEKGEPIYQTWDNSMNLPAGYSIMPFFPGYEFTEFGRHSSYRDVETVGEGGYVYSEPGIHGRTKTLDVASEHPSSIDEEDLFGPEYTHNFRMLKKARLAIKHGDFELARTILPEVVHEYLNDPSMAKGLANALKTVINAIYGQTSATYDCVFKDPRNKDNIVAKRGALFMINLRNNVQRKGYQVLHCKTDSIKIVEPTEQIEEYIYNYGKEFGYEFEVEHIFERICLVDKANYIAKLANDDPEEPGTWTATGDKFARPFVFKTLFTKEKIELADLNEIKSVKTSLYLDFNEDLEKDNHKYRFVGRVGGFVPVQEGTGGGLLMRVSGENEDGSIKFAAAEGTKGWRWKETAVVEANNLQDTINMNYYRAMVDEVIDSINLVGDGCVNADEFCSEEPIVELPFK